MTYALNNMVPANTRTSSPSCGPEHIVQFYEDEDALCRFASEFLASGLVAGDAVIMLVMPGHRELILGGMRALGARVEDARAAGRLIVMDARETLDAISQGDQPDKTRFVEVVGGLFTKLRVQHQGLGLRAYGEMVELLWAAGKRDAALRLEEMWNQLQGEFFFSLLCAYGAAGFYREPQEFRSVCSAHTHVVAPRLEALERGTATPAQQLALLAAEVTQRKEVEQALRGSLRALHHAEDELRKNQAELLRELERRTLLERSREATSQRTERLTRVTSAIADAVTHEQVMTAIVHDIAAALGASSVGLWLVSEDGASARLARSLGFRELSRCTLGELALDSSLNYPVLEALRTGTPAWFESETEFLAPSPLRALVSDRLTHGGACLPITAQGRVLGALGIMFERATPVDHEERHFLFLVARYCAQALERLRLLEREQRARNQAELLFRMADAVIRAEHVDEVFDAALETIQRALSTERCSILALDAQGVMRFRAFRGLSQAYRDAVEGHSPWSRDARAPELIVVADVRDEPGLGTYRALFEVEDIRALAFIPLVSSGRLLGKFMVYYRTPRTLSRSDVELAQAIANHVAAAIARFTAISELQETVRFNEMFTGMLGHDLRNPLGAMITAAQLALKRSTEDDRIRKPLSRILTSGARMARMIEQLLDLTRVRVGAGIAIHPKRIELGDLLRQVIDELDDAHPNCTFDLRHEGGDTSGSWDEDRLSQVFSNLLANAVQHGIPERGVRVRLRGDVPGHVRAEVHNGGTIPVDLIPRLFEPMAGGDRPREKSQGLGLGLYITREILRAHGGTIDVQSSEEHGTTICVCLPRTPAPAAEVVVQ